MRINQQYKWLIFNMFCSWVFQARFIYYKIKSNYIYIQIYIYIYVCVCVCVHTLSEIIVMEAPSLKNIFLQSRLFIFQVSRGSSFGNQYHSQRQYRCGNSIYFAINHMPICIKLKGQFSSDGGSIINFGCAYMNFAYKGTLTSKSHLLSAYVKMLYQTKSTHMNREAYMRLKNKTETPSSVSQSDFLHWRDNISTLNQPPGWDRWHLDNHSNKVNYVSLFYSN